MRVPGAWRRAPAWFRYSLFFLLGIFLAALLFGCGERPDRRPAPPDTIARPDTILAPTDTSAGPEALIPDSVPDSTVVLPPDTVERPVTPADTVQPPAGRRRAAAPLTGKAVGLIRWPTDKWCGGPLNGSVQSFAPKYAGGLVRKAAACQHRIIGMIPRSQMTHNGEVKGRWSLTRGKQACNALRAVLPPDSLRKYSKTLVALMPIDEPQSGTWGGVVAKASEVAEFLRYCKARLPGLAMAPRIPPNHKWLKTLPVSAWSGADLWWAMWHKRRGPRQPTDQNGICTSLSSCLTKQRLYYAAEQAGAARYGDGLIRGINVRDIEGANSNEYATGTELRAFGAAAIRAPGNCFFPAWWYETAMWSNSSIRSAWTYLADLGRASSYTTCGGG